MIKKVFDYFVWFLFVGFFLLGGAIYAADRIYPGDYLYPLKLKFESFELATSEILNNQVDFSIDLVGKRANEATKTLGSRYSKDGLDSLNTQVRLTSTSISKISDPIEKKKAAEKYIVKLNEASAILSEKQKDLIATPTSSNITPQINITTKPTDRVSQNQITPTIMPLPETSTVSQQIDNTQETIQEAIDGMTDLTTNRNNSPRKSEGGYGEEKDTGKPDSENGNQKDSQIERGNQKDNQNNQGD